MKNIIYVLLHKPFMEISEYPEETTEKRVIMAKLIGSEKPPVEDFYAKINLRNRKWLISFSYV